MDLEHLYDYQKYAILYVDDEEMSLKYFTRAFRNKFRIFSAANARDGYRLLEQHRDEISLVMTDQRMPGEKGVQFLERARQLHPRAIRILTTAYSDLDVAIEAVNSGAIYKYATKPWDVPQLEATLKRALEFFMVQQDRDLLLKEKLSALHRMMIADRVLTLGIVAARLGDHVRNSLVAVRTFLELAPDKLLDEKKEGEELRNPNFWKEFYGHAQNQIRRITELLTDLVDATGQRSSPTVQALNLNESVTAVAEKLEGRLAEKGISVVNQVPSDLPPLIIELESFQRLLDLLLKDEIISLPNASRVLITARACQDNADEELELEISDNGPGLPRDALRSIFDPFFLFTDDRQEIGINLMACYFLVYHLGGRVEVQSEEGQGAMFKLVFPKRPKATASTQEDEVFISKVLMNDALWERLITGY
ncbi:MAG TPA: hybrid sensor histidine kinase/response regulator [Candidatus Binatia bacterium]|jgi:two-component system probable response regulator PhcQ